MPGDPLAWLDDELTTLDAQHLRRRLITCTGPQRETIVLDGQTLVNFSANDYLGLAADLRLTAAAIEAAGREGCGAGASPLVTGHSASHAELERRLAEFEGTEAALVFTSGFAANLGTVAALVERGDAIYADAKNHASLIDGCRLSRAESSHLPPRRRRSSGGTIARRVALSSTADRDRLAVQHGWRSRAAGANWPNLAEQHSAMLMVDEAHATGVFGAHGRGVAEHLGVEDGVHIRMGTLSKALGCAGGFVAGRAA